MLSQELHKISKLCLIEFFIDLEWILKDFTWKLGGNHAHLGSDAFDLILPRETRRICACALRACCDNRGNLQNSLVSPRIISFFTSQRAICIWMIGRHSCWTFERSTRNKRPLGTRRRISIEQLQNAATFGSVRVQKVQESRADFTRDVGRYDAPSVLRSRSKKTTSCRDVIPRISCLSRSMSAHKITLTSRTSFPMAGCEARKVTQLRAIDESRFVTRRGSSRLPECVAFLCMVNFCETDDLKRR